MQAELNPLEGFDWNIILHFTKESFQFLGKDNYQAIINDSPPSTKQVALLISGERAHNTLTTPTTVNFGFLTNDRTHVRSVVVANRAMGDRFTIHEVRSYEPFIKAGKTAASKGHYTLEVTVTPSGLTDRHTFENFITLVTNDPEDEKPHVRLVGSVVDPKTRRCCGN
jgi:hypothetical protein